MAAISTKKTTQLKRLLCPGVQPLPLPFYIQFLSDSQETPFIYLLLTKENPFTHQV